MSEVYTLHMDDKTIIFPLDKGDINKMVIAACAKEEDNYIVEWIKHHLSIGFEKIIIADNNDDQARLETLLQNFVESGNVQILNFSGLKEFQLQFYNMIAGEKNFEWCAFIDIDEFIEITPRYKDIRDFCNSVHESCICLNWMMYGSSMNMVKDTYNVQDRFNEPTHPIYGLKENFYLKTIIHRDSKNVWFTNPHVPKIDGDYNVGGYSLYKQLFQSAFPARFKRAYIKHYYTKTGEEFLKKIKRGWPDTAKYIDVGVEEKYKLLTNSATNIPIERMSMSIFASDMEHNNYKTICNNYDVIYIDGAIDNMPSFITTATQLMLYGQNLTLVIDDRIDDSIYNLLRDYADKTNTNLTTCTYNDILLYDIYQRCTKGKGNSYYHFYIY